MWASEQSVETTATPEAVWRVWQNISGWSDWNIDVGSPHADGPLVTGTTITMTEPGLGPVKCRVVAAVEGQSFTVTYDLEGATLSITLRVAEWAGKTRIYYRMVAEGPNDQIVGQQLASAVSERVPQSLAKLLRLLGSD